MTRLVVIITSCEWNAFVPPQTTAVLDTARPAQANGALYWVRRHNIAAGLLAGHVTIQMEQYLPAAVKSSAFFGFPAQQCQAF